MANLGFFSKRKSPGLDFFSEKMKMLYMHWEIVHFFSNQLCNKAKFLWKVTKDSLSLTQAIGFDHTTIEDFVKDKNDLKGENNKVARGKNSSNSSSGGNKSEQRKE